MIHVTKLVFFVVCIYLSQYSVQATVFSCNATAPCGCSRFNADINARIVGGETAASHSWGWAVSLRDSVGRHKCGGTIISPSYVLTAAHCVEDYKDSPSMYTVVVGADTLNSTEGLKLSLRTIFSHPNYNLRTKENDIAILLLSTPITFSNFNVAKICLPALPSSEQAHYPIVKKPVVAIGWGSITTSGSASNSLRQVTVNTVGNEEKKCKYYSIKNFDFQFCAAVNGGGKDTCQGDSGGPLMYYSENEQQWVLAGITSHGVGCASPNYAGIYTRVGTYVHWIKTIVGNDGMVTIAQSGANLASISNLTIIAAVSVLIMASFYN